MTLLPSNEFGIKGHPGNAYDVNKTCAVPGCPTPSAHAHHMWPRSFLAPPYEWVSLPEGIVIGNRIGLCVHHHNEVTGEVGGYKARLIWEAGQMWWEERMTLAQAHTHHYNEVTFLPDGSEIVWARLGMLSSQPPLAGQEIHASLPEGEVCPTCGHHKVMRANDRSQLKPGKLRPSKEWTVTVPDDAEVGVDLLDEWVKDFAIAFDMDEFSSRLKRYHVLSVLRGVTYALRPEIIKLVAEAAERRVA